MAATAVASVSIVVERLTATTPEVIADFNRLLPQLKPSWDPVTPESVDAVLKSPTRVYVARDGDAIVGMILLVPHRHMPGLRFHIEDVVVDDASRRQGIAKQLLETAMADVPDEVISFDLRSHHSRAAARELYLGLGFEPSETTVYRRPR